MKTARLVLAFLLFVSVSVLVAQQRVEVTNLANPAPVTGTVNIGTVATVTNPVSVSNSTATSLKTESVGTLSNNAAITTTNLGAIPCLANAAETAYTEGRPVFLSCTLDGGIRMVFKDGAGNDRYMNVDASGRGSVSIDAITTAATGTQTAANSDSIVCATDTGCVIKAASGALASGSIASGAIASGALASGAYASGSVGSGAYASGSIASGALASGSIASGALASGSIAASAAAVGAFPAQAFAVGAIPPAAGTLASGAVTSAMTGTTTTSVIGATASNYIYVTNCVVSNASLTVSTDIILQDGSGGTTLYNIPAPAAAVATTGGGGASVSFPVPLKVPTSGNALFAANVTTGSSTKISCSGFKSTVSY